MCWPDCGNGDQMIVMTVTTTSHYHQSSLSPRYHFTTSPLWPPILPPLSLPYCRHGHHGFKTHTSWKDWEKFDQLDMFPGHEASWIERVTVSKVQSDGAFWFHASFGGKSSRNYFWKRFLLLNVSSNHLNFFSEISYQGKIFSRGHFWPQEFDCLLRLEKVFWARAWFK